MCVARMNRELLRSLTVSFWEISPSSHVLSMLPPQAKLPVGQVPLEVSESWENVLWGSFGKGPLRLSGVSAKLPQRRAGSESGPLGALGFLELSHELCLGYSP